MTLDASGYLGLGTTSPSSYGGLAVRKAVTVSNVPVSASFSDSANSTFDIRHSENIVNLSAQGSGITINTGNSTRMTIASTGVVTLTSQPILSSLTASSAVSTDSSKGLVSVTNTGSGNNVLSASPTLTGTVAAASLSLSSLTSGRVTYAGASGLLSDSANLIFNGTGLGIGVSPISTGLAVKDSIRVVGATTSSISFSNAYNQNFADIFYDDSTGNFNIFNTRTYPLILGVNNTEKMRFTGNNIYTASGVAFAIGTSSVVEALTVNGAIAVTGGITGHGANRTTLSQEGANGAYWQSYGANTSTYGTFKLRQASSDFSLSRTAVEIDTSGNLGLGVTPSAWGTSWKAFQVGIGTSLVAHPTLLYTFLGSNWFQNGPNDKYITTNTAGVLSMNGNVFSFLQAPSGSAGDTISFTQAMTLDSSGNLIVGGTTATNTAANRGNITINGTSSAILSIGTGGTARGVVYHSGSDMIINATTGTLALQANSNGALIDTSGNLGLGVTPSAWGSGSKGFQVLKGGLWHDNSQYFALVNNAYYDGTNWKYISTAASSQITQINGESRFYNAASGTAGNTVTFTQAMTLDASGNLGIGTSSPAFKTEIVGGATTVETTLFQIRSNAGGIGTGSTIAFANSTNASAGSGRVEIAGIRDTASGSSFVIRTADSSGTLTERMRLNTSGNLGLGVTPSASTSNYRTLQIGDGNNSYSMFGQRVAGASEGFMGWNLYGGSNTTTLGSGFYYRSTGDATTLYTQNAQHTWWNAPSGTAGNAITFTQAMTLDSSGNLLVGATTSLYSSGKLQITGGKTIINSTDAAFGVFQLGNSGSNSEVSMQFISGVTAFGTSPTSTNGDNFCWNIGAGNYGIGGDSFSVANKGNGGVNVKLAYNSSSWISVSDERIKDIESDITNAYEIIKDWRTVYYTLKSDPLKITKIGLLAQDVQKTLPMAVDIPKIETDNKGKLNPWGVHYTDVIPVLVKAIQEQQALIESLTTRLTALEGK
jgi:hypothetical protein